MNDRKKTFTVLLGKEHTINLSSWDAGVMHSLRIDCSCLNETNSSVCSHMCACMSPESVNGRQSSLF